MQTWTGEPNGYLWWPRLPTLYYFNPGISKSICYDDSIAWGSFQGVLATARNPTQCAERPARLMGLTWLGWEEIRNDRQMYSKSEMGGLCTPMDLQQPSAYGKQHRWGGGGFPGPWRRSLWGSGCAGSNHTCNTLALKASVDARASCGCSQGLVSILTAEPAIALNRNCRWLCHFQGALDMVVPLSAQSECYSHIIS